MTKAAELAKWGEVSTNGQVSGRRNLMYNGNFQCWQRSTNVTGLGTASGYFTADRWRVNLGDTSAGRFTMTRTAGDPDGFNYGLVINCTTADTSIAAGEQLRINQRFEGQDLQHLKKGTSGAETTTISFYAKIVGSATDFVVELQDSDNTRSISKIFTFTTDWVRYYWTIPGDTTGALDQDTAMSMTLNFWLHAGSTYTSGTLNTDWNSRTNANIAAGIDSIFASTDNEFYLAGVQWEVGSVTTPFEHRSYGEELALCQRYYFESIGKTFGGHAPETSRVLVDSLFRTQMRSTPTLTAIGQDGTTGKCSRSVDNSLITVSSFNGQSVDGIHQILGTFVQNAGYFLGVIADSEL
tara:strand:+ start:746 stop:1804 length:1059 start_codon:yes stop_codon:yes gene_type:complete